MVAGSTENRAGNAAEMRGAPEEIPVQSPKPASLTLGLRVTMSWDCTQSTAQGARLSSG